MNSNINDNNPNNNNSSLINESQNEVVNQPQEISFFNKNRYIIFTCIKGVLGCCFLLASYFNDYMATKPQNGFFCIYDWTHNISEKTNSFLNSNVPVKYFLLVSSTSLIYFVIIYAFVHWIIKGVSWRLPLALGVYILFRFIAQFGVRMINPVGYDPNPPAAVNFFSNPIKFHDFFFDLYIGLPIICGLEFFKNANYIMFGVCMFSSLYELFVAIFTRSHYIIDIFAGLLFAHYIYLLTSENVHHLDKSSLSIDPDFENQKVQ